MLHIQRAQLEDIGKLAPLFDAYRIFYQQESDIKAAKTFLKERLKNGQSIILMALWKEKVVGFTQLYITSSSVSMQPFFILNDLYVLTEFRGKGIGEKLLETAKELCRERGFKGLALETAKDNPAQRLYEKLDWKSDTEYLHYFWTESSQNS